MNTGRTPAGASLLPCFLISWSVKRKEEIADEVYPNGKRTAFISFRNSKQKALPDS
jgi:hypothetical protein